MMLDAGPSVPLGGSKMVSGKTIICHVLCTVPWSRFVRLDLLFVKIRRTKTISRAEVSHAITGKEIIHIN